MSTSNNLLKYYDKIRSSPHKKNTKVDWNDITLPLLPILLKNTIQLNIDQENT